MMSQTAENITNRIAGEKGEWDSNAIQKGFKTAQVTFIMHVCLNHTGHILKTKKPKRT